MTDHVQNIDSKYYTPFKHLVLDEVLVYFKKIYHQETNVSESKFTDYVTVQLCVEPG
jgi:hypothetical protein